MVCSSLGHLLIITVSCVADYTFINANLIIYLRCESGTWWALDVLLMINLLKTMCLLLRPGEIVYVVLEEEEEQGPRFRTGNVSWLLFLVELLMLCLDLAV